MQEAKIKSKKKQLEDEESNSSSATGSFSRSLSSSFSKNKKKGSVSDAQEFLIDSSKDEVDNGVFAKLDLIQNREHKS